MAKNDNLTDFLTDVANAIRAKKGISGKINPQDFSAEIASIESGGGGDAPQPSEPLFPVIGDGKTYLYITIAEKGRMTVPLYFSQTVANGVNIDWGDGSTSESISGTGNKNTTHVYAVPGDYAISLSPVDGCTLGLGHGSSSYCVLGSASTNGLVYCNMLQGVEIGDNVTIGTYAFSNCSSLASVVISDGVTSIGGYAFKGCYSLASVVIPGSITSIDTYAFNYCYSLASVVIPGSVTSIGTYAFYNCSSLASVVISDGVTRIANYAFSYCHSLASVVIPGSITSIGTNAFSNCPSLASVVIPGSITSIGANAFSNCYSLASVVIPGSVTSIGTYAFYNCYGMAYYDFRASKSVPTLSNKSAFTSIPSDCKMVIPDALFDEWSTATNWSTYASRMVKASEFNG